MLRIRIPLPGVYVPSRWNREMIRAMLSLVLVSNLAMKAQVEAFYLPAADFYCHPEDVCLPCPELEPDGARILHCLEEVRPTCPICLEEVCPIYPIFPHCICGGESRDGWAHSLVPVW